METFNQFIRNLLLRMNPYNPDADVSPKSVIVLDNCQIHKDPEILEYIREWYVNLISWNKTDAL